MTQKQKNKRISWCKLYENKDLDFWKKIIFSDESIFCVQMSLANRRIRRLSFQNPYNEKFMVKTIKHPPYWMIWGCFKSNTLGPLNFIDGNVNAQKYISILNDSLIGFYQPNNIFQDDSAPAHRAKTVKDFLREHQIETLEWPSNSPDLNPIEHLWAYMKMALRKKMITSKSQLKSEIANIWKNEISKDFLEKLILSMPSRIKECLKNKGGVTRY